MSYIDPKTMPRTRQPLKYSPGRLRYTSLFFVMILQACFSPDPNTVSGLIEAVAQAVEDQDVEQLFRCLDEKARHALWGIVRARQAAKHLIDTDYPEQDRQAALRALGEGAFAESGPALLARRCDQACLGAIGAQLGAPTQVTAVGAVVRVTTTRGSVLELRPPQGNGHYGLIWQSEVLAAERDRAYRELKQIEDNAALYRRKRALSRRPTAATPEVGSTALER